MDETKSTASRGRVAETTCAVYHPVMHREHVLEGGHSHGPRPSGIGINRDRNHGVPHCGQMPRTVMQVG